MRQRVLLTEHLILINHLPAPLLSILWMEHRSILHDGSVVRHLYYTNKVSCGAQVVVRSDHVSGEHIIRSNGFKAGQNCVPSRYCPAQVGLPLSMYGVWV